MLEDVAGSRTFSTSYPDSVESVTCAQCEPAFSCGEHREPVAKCQRTPILQRAVAVTVLESGPLELQSEACLEFWYLTGSELRTLLRSSIDEVEIWSSPALPGGEWRQVFVPLNVMEPGIQVVFEAHEAVSMAGQVRLNQIGVRTGSCGSQCESNTELWTDESTRCLCSDGQLSCSTSQCPQGHTCGPQRLGSSEVLPSGTCTVHSDTDCSTFDGVLFRFMAPCSYVLTKGCSPSAAMPAFSVAVVNKPNGNSSLSTVQQVDVVVGKSRVSLLKGMTHRVVVNGVWKRLPLHLPDVRVKSNPVAVSLRTTFGLLVSYDTAGAIHVTLPSKFSDEVCGLCGNFNHLREDDFTMPDGTNAGDATALAESWQVGQTSSSCEAMLVPYPCNSLEMAEYASEMQCGSLLSSTGPFASCHAVVGSEGYFRGCVASMCSTFGDPMVLCETLEAYAGICQEAGVSLPLWRNSSLCPLQCGENSHYNSCADGCPDVCSSMDIIGSCGSCEERCECDSGYKLNGGKCVPSEDCGCWYKGKHLKKGEEMLEGECETRCLCMGNNDMRCESMRCADNEVCKVQDGVKGCFAFHPATCRVYGDPHYMTYDGMAYDFQGGCSYTLTTTCGRESAVQFSVIGHNMHPPFQNSSRSKLQAVALLVEDLHLTLNMSGDVYVNTSPVTIPFFTNGSFGLVGVDMFNNFIVLESTFGLRIMIDGEHRLFLQVDERYKYELCGLCGTYSGYQDDDFVTPGGQNASGPFEFGDSWRLPDSDGCVSHPDEPRVCDYNEENEAYNECYALLGEPFNPCHEKIHPSIYLNSCVYDYCATSGDQYTLCESLKSYAVACEAAGVELSNWQTGTACANSTTTATPPTPPTPPTTPTSSSSTPDQTLCPMNCDFENNLCGWEQLIQDSFDWTRNSGPTPTNLTGPNQDHTTGAGFYMYIEGNSVTHGDSARLMSSMCGYDGPLCLNFWYHMHGSATAMALNIYLLKGNKATKLWSKVNNQGPEWFPGNIDIKESGPFKIIIEGIRGANEHSDIAIDDISIHFGSCPGNLAYQGPSSATTDTLPSHPVCRFDCTFDSNLCAWSQMVTDAFDWTWHSGSTPTMMTGPSSDHTGGGHYLYIEASSVTHGDTSRLISSECSDSGPQCLQFWYHMYGSADTMGLHVYLLQNRYADAVFWKRNDQGNMWHMAQVDLTTTGPFQVIFEGRRGSNEESDIAIDDNGQIIQEHLPMNPKHQINHFYQQQLDHTNQQQLVHRNRQQLDHRNRQQLDHRNRQQLDHRNRQQLDHRNRQQLDHRNRQQLDHRNRQQLDHRNRQQLDHRNRQQLDHKNQQQLDHRNRQQLDHRNQQQLDHKNQQQLDHRNRQQLDHRNQQQLDHKNQQQLDHRNQQQLNHNFLPRLGHSLHPQINHNLQQQLDPSLRPQLRHCLQQHIDPDPQPPPNHNLQPQVNLSHLQQLYISISSSSSELAPFCPEDSHYTTCVPACSPSCSLLNGPPHCSNQGCVPGCVCDDGFVQKGKVCVPIQQCGCVDRNGTKHQFDDVWYTDHCSQKCKCKKDHGVGRIECEEEDECDGDAVCLQNENNDYYCQSTGFGECTIKGDPEYRTFDRFKHEFEGEHSYVLVQTRNLPNNLQEVYIEGINRRSDDEDDSHENDDSSSEEDDSRSARDEDDDDDDDSEEDNEHNHLRELKIRVYGRTVEFKRRRKLIMDGKRTSTPVSIPGLSIWQHSSHIYLRTDFGLSIEFDGQSEAEIILPNLYKRKVGGLCGNFDGRKQNDMMKPDGTRARNVQEFGESWEV
ncbi:zonadhesin [Halichoeres trimaculatus]|uniref:zonadhesin n=1 Tax=Halichoeres trimaculatus TaxID=147232 RepID=UPI003D9FA65F